MAQSNLGLMFEIGQGVNQDYKAAFKWYKRAADQGNADAQNNLGFMYLQGLGVTQDYKVALKWYKLAADGKLSKIARVGFYASLYPQRSAATYIIWNKYITCTWHDFLNTPAFTKIPYHECFIGFGI